MIIVPIEINYNTMIYKRSFFPVIVIVVLFVPELCFKRGMIWCCVVNVMCLISFVFVVYVDMVDIRYFNLLPQSWNIAWIGTKRVWWIEIKIRSSYFEFQSFIWHPWAKKVTSQYQSLSHWYPCSVIVVLVLLGVLIKIFVTHVSFQS